MFKRLQILYFKIIAFSDDACVANFKVSRFQKSCRLKATALYIIVVNEYEQSFLEPELRPEYKAKLAKIMKGKHLSD
ncbi:DUF2683 family protein [Candidatus Woesearchaeota archaeon]|nr:DUF2683 family protein [Candidatus Woesearchaeota archaeon]